jgi:aryl-alcohol dehydrogenase-like predicted oxidoreductase
VALAFLAHVSAGFTIPKASRRRHVEENAAAAAVELPPEALRRLEEAFPLGAHSGGVHTW